MKKTLEIKTFVPNAFTPGKSANYQNGTHLSSSRLKEETISSAMKKSMSK